MIYLYVHVCFVLPWSVESFRFIFGAGITNLNEPPFSIPPHYCWLGAGSIPFGAIVNNKQCEMRGLFIAGYWGYLSLVIQLFYLGQLSHCAMPNLCHVLEHVLGVLPANVNCRLPTSPVC